MVVKENPDRKKKKKLESLLIILSKMYWCEVTVYLYLFRDLLFEGSLVFLPTQRILRSEKVNENKKQPISEVNGFL